MSQGMTDFGEFYGSAYGPLVGLLRTMGATAADAEELAQDAFAKAWLRWRRISRYDDPAGWARSVAVKGMISRWRREQVARRGFWRLAGRHQADEGAPEPDDSDVNAALAHLSRDHRAVLVLHYALDLPVAQVSAELGVPEGTVKSRLARARAALAEHLHTHEGSRS